MKPLPPRVVHTSQTLGPGIAIAIVIAIGVYSYLDGEAYRQAAADAEQSREFVQQTQELVSLINDAESGQRGYLLTGDTGYLLHYTAALPQIAAAQQVLRHSGLADPKDTRRMADLVAGKIAEMAQTIEIRRHGSVPAALASVRTNLGRESMEQIRALAGRLIRQENAGYQESRARTERHGYKTRGLVLVGTVLLAMLLWISNRQINLLLRSQRQLILDLDSSREQEARGRAALATTLRSIGDAVIATDTAGRVRFLNAAAEQLTGWHTADAEQLPLAEVCRVLHESSHTQAGDPAVRILADGKRFGNAGGFLLVARDGRESPVEYSGAPVLDETGALTGVALVFRDITDRRKLEEQLRQSQKLEAVGQLAGGIAHDFNNLLTVIEGYAEMMQAEEAEDSPNRDSAQEILVAAQRAASLTRQLLAFSRRQVLQPIRLNLNANVTSTQRMLTRLLGENIQVVTHTPAGLWDVMADPGQMDQIIVNLAVNARDAMMGGGKLTIETDNVTVDLAEAAGFMDMQPGSYVRLSITDTGHGMDAETRLRVFEPFFTTKAIGCGTGLGLSTVYGIVKQSQGQIHVESEPEKGACFRIFLPAAEAGSAASAPSPLKPAMRLASETVLVVEDDDSVRALVTAMLKSLGYRVLCPATTEEALGTCADRRMDIDLLLTDMVLTQTDGTAVAQQAKSLRTNLKVLYMSGYTDHPVLQQPDLMNDRFLQKPFTKAALASKLREMLD